MSAGDETGEGADRAAFFDRVYRDAEGDAQSVPWADLAAKPELAEWLARHPGAGQAALDVACGLGDNAEAIAAAGYGTVAFDSSSKAIEWARQRFAGSPVDYRVADLFDPPREWTGRFDLVNECYTIQSFPPAEHERVARAVAAWVKPGGVLLVYALTRPEDRLADGPPWPLMPSETDIFAELGFDRVGHRPFTAERPGRTVTLVFDMWRRRAGNDGPSA